VTPKDRCSFDGMLGGLRLVRSTASRADKPLDIISLPLRYRLLHAASMTGSRLIAIQAAAISHAL
jgi:hypothetical protein